MNNNKISLALRFVAGMNFIAGSLTGTFICFFIGSCLFMVDTLIQIVEEVKKDESNNEDEA